MQNYAKARLQKGYSWVMRWYGMRRNVLTLEIIYGRPVKIQSKYSINASIFRGVFCFLGQKLFRMKKNNHKHENFLMNNETLIR